MTRTTPPTQALLFQMKLDGNDSQVRYGTTASGELNDSSAKTANRSSRCGERMGLSAVRTPRISPLLDRALELEPEE
jgi:hypothetical protein